MPPRPDRISDLLPSFERHLLAKNRSPRTITNYLGAATTFEEFLVDAGHSTNLEDIGRRQIEEFIVHQLDRRSASTSATRFRCLQQYFKWLTAEGEIDSNPMENLTAPTVADAPVPRADSLSPGWRRCSAVEVDKLASTVSRRIGSGTRSRTCGSPAAETKEISRCSPDGAALRCSNATEHPRRPSERGTLTEPTHPETSCEDHLRSPTRISWSVWKGTRCSPRDGQWLVLDRSKSERTA